MGKDEMCVSIPVNVAAPRSWVWWVSAIGTELKRQQRKAEFTNRNTKVQQQVALVNFLRKSQCSFVKDVY